MMKLDDFVNDVKLKEKELFQYYMNNISKFPLYQNYQDYEEKKKEVDEAYKKVLAMFEGEKK